MFSRPYRTCCVARQSRDRATGPRDVVYVLLSVSRDRTTVQISVQISDRFIETGSNWLSVATAEKAFNSQKCLITLYIG